MTPAPPADGVVFQIEGIAEVRKQFRAMKDSAQPGIIRSGLRASVKPIVTDAKERAPVDTGRLRKAIKVSVDRSRDRKSMVAKIGFDKKAWYGVFVEMGTAKMAAQPFLRPAMASKKGEVAKAFFAGVLKRIEKILAKQRAAAA